MTEPKNIYTFHVTGTHCASCKILIEDVLQEQPGVLNVVVDLKNETVMVETDVEQNPEIFVNELSSKIEPHNYTLSVEKTIKESNSNNTLWLAIPIGILFLILFFLLQKSGVLNLGIGGAITPQTSFIIGLIASVSSCLAIVGGLVLSLSAKYAQDEESSKEISKKPFVLFHLGRLVGFAVLGGVLGFIGKALGINFLFSAILGLIASIVMILLGFNLVGILKKNKFTLPTGMFKFFRKVEHADWAPLVLGVGTFFLPCGFTQSMQVAALSSGSYSSGFLIMLFFALGTLPMLALISFGSASFANSKYAPLFFKSAGVVVIGLGLFALLSGLAGLGVINPLFNL